MSSGHQAEGIEISDPEAHEVFVTDAENAALRNVNIKPGQYMSIEPSFQLNDVTDLQKEYEFAVSQELSTENPDAEKYGTNCYYTVTVNGKEENDKETEEKDLQKRVNNDPAVDKTNVPEGLHLYPNPSNDKVTIQCKVPQEEKTVTVSITDVWGKIVFQKTEKPYSKTGSCQLSINTSDIREGMYVVTVQAGKYKKSAALSISH